MKTHKLLFTFAIFVVLLTACSKDQDSTQPELFLANHVGAWETTFVDTGVNVAAEITASTAKIYSKLISEGCYNRSGSISSGSVVVDTHTSTEYTAVTENVIASEIFSGTDLELLQNNGINYIDIEYSYQSAGENYIAFAEYIYVAGTNDIILSVSGTFGKVNTIVKC